MAATVKCWALCLLVLGPRYHEETSSTQSITNGFDEPHFLSHTVIKGQLQLTTWIYMYMFGEFALL